MRQSIIGGYFDTDNHSYWTEDGVRIPSITQVLRLTGLVDYSGIDPAVLENAARRGSEVHELAAAKNQYGEVDESWITDETRPYFSAYLNFLNDTGFTPDHAWIEQAIIATIGGMKLGITPDVHGKLGRDLWIIEFKTTATVMDGTSIQTAAQELAVLNSNHVGRCRRGVLQLKKDGKYKLHHHTNHSEDEADLIGALRVVWRRIRSGEGVWDKLG